MVGGYAALAYHDAFVSGNAVLAKFRFLGVDRHLVGWLAELIFHWRDWWSVNGVDKTRCYVGDVANIAVLFASDYFLDVSGQSGAGRFAVLWFLGDVVGDVFVVFSYIAFYDGDCSQSECERMNWAWFHKLGSPKWFYSWSKAWALPVFCFGCLCLVIGLVWGLAFAPADYQQGNSFRIIYIHVPVAMLAQSCYLAMGIAGVVFLVWQMKMSPIFIKAMAPVGAIMALIALVSGAIWGKPTWGTWWVWDARLTSVLVLFLLYMGIIALQNTIDDVLLANKAAAVLSVVGLINLPIIKYSVVLLETLHQGPTFTLTKKPEMPAEMWLPLLFSVIGLYCFVAGLVLWRMQSEILLREHRSSWVKQEVTENGL